MASSGRYLTGSVLNAFLQNLQIRKIAPIGLSSASGEQATEAQLDLLLSSGDPVPPGNGVCPEDASTVHALQQALGPLCCLGLTPDGHLVNHEPIRFDPVLAVEQVIQLSEANIAADDKEEALAATWLGLAYHDHDHASDFGGLLIDASAGSSGRAKCCYVDVKGTSAANPSAQRTKLEQRARERKFGCLSRTVTKAVNNGYAGYPGRGLPGLMATLLHNPVAVGKRHAGYAVSWFFGISKNYQAAQAVWGWGGEQGVKLPAELRRQLASREVTIEGQKKSQLTLLGEYRDYSQFKGENGEWDRETLQATLEAKALAARYLLMHEDPVQHAEAAVVNLNPPGIQTPLRPEDFEPGESFAVYFGRQCDDAIRQLRQAEEELQDNKEKLQNNEEKLQNTQEKLQNTEEKLQNTEEKLRQNEERSKVLFLRLHKLGEVTAEEIAEARKKGWIA